MALWGQVVQEGQSLGLRPRLLVPGRETNLAFASYRRRLARPTHGGAEQVLHGEHRGVEVLVRVLDRTPADEGSRVYAAVHDLQALAATDPPWLASAIVATQGSWRAWMGGDPVRTGLPRVDFALFAYAAAPERLTSALAPRTRDDGFGDQLVARLAARPGLALLDGVVEDVSSLDACRSLRPILDEVTDLAREVSRRLATVSDTPPLAAWKARVAELAARRDLAFDPARARLYGSAGGTEVESVVEAVARGFATTATLRFPSSLGAALRVRRALPRDPTTAFRARHLVHPDLPSFDVDDPTPGRSRVAKPGVAAALLALAALAELELDEATLSATVDAPLDAPDMERLLDAALAVAHALCPPPAAPPVAPYR